MKPLFLVAAAASLSAVTPSDSRAWEYLRERYDRNGDGRISAEEYPRGKEAFARLDRNGDARLDASDFEGTDRRGRRGAEGKRRPAARDRESGAAEGTAAPDFTLEPLRGGNPVTLSSFSGKKPVALVFGSYT